MKKPYTYLSYKDTKKRLFAIKDKENKALLCLIYASLGRVGEIVNHKLDKNINPPLNAEDIFIDFTPSGKKYVAIKVLTEKINTTRIVPVFPNREYWLIKPFWKKKKQIKEGPMFDFSTRWAEKIFEKEFGDLCPKTPQRIHLLRHWRVTHCLNGNVTGKPVPERIVARWTGHSKLSSQATYDHSVTDDYIDDVYKEESK